MTVWNSCSKNDSIRNTCKNREERSIAASRILRQIGIEIDQSAADFRQPISDAQRSPAASAIDYAKRSPSTESARSAGSECYKSRKNCQLGNNFHQRRIAKNYQNYHQENRRRTLQEDSMSDRISKNNTEMANTKTTERKKRNGGDSDRESKKPPPQPKKTRKQSDKKYGDFVCPTCQIHLNQASNRKTHGHHP